MNQTRLGSFIEACINTAIGFIGSILLGLIVYPMFGHAFSITEVSGITVIFTIWSLIRGYAIRRWFNARIHAAAQRLAAAAS